VLLPEQYNGEEVCYGTCGEVEPARERASMTRDLDISLKRIESNRAFSKRCLCVIQCSACV